MANIPATQHCSIAQYAALILCLCRDTTLLKFPSTDSRILRKTIDCFAQAFLIRPSKSKVLLELCDTFKLTVSMSFTLPVLLH